MKIPKKHSADLECDRCNADIIYDAVTLAWRCTNHFCLHVEPVRAMVAADCNTKQVIIVSLN